MQRSSDLIQALKRSFDSSGFSADCIVTVCVRSVQQLGYYTTTEGERGLSRDKYTLTHLHPCFYRDLHPAQSAACRFVFTTHFDRVKLETAAYVSVS